MCGGGWVCVCKTEGLRRQGAKKPNKHLNSTGVLDLYYIIFTKSEIN